VSLKSFQHDVDSSSAQLRVITSGIPQWQHTRTRDPGTARPVFASRYFRQSAWLCYLQQSKIASDKSAEIDDFWDNDDNKDNNDGSGNGGKSSRSRCLSAIHFVKFVCRPRDVLKRMLSVGAERNGTAFPPDSRAKSRHLVIYYRVALSRHELLFCGGMTDKPPVYRRDPFSLVWRLILSRLPNGFYYTRVILTRVVDCYYSVRTIIEEYQSFLRQYRLDASRGRF